MDETLRKDFVSLNKRYLYLIRQISADKRASLLMHLGHGVIEKIGAMTIDELDSLAEDMPVPCFMFDKTTLDIFIQFDHTSRRAYLLNSSVF